MEQKPQKEKISIIEKLKKLIGDKYVESIATLIALIALFSGIRSNCESQKHNELSYKPYFTFYEQKNIPKTSMSVSLNNFGPGPAIIREIKYLIDNEERIITQDEDMFKLLKELGADPDKENWYFEIIRKNDVIQSDKSYTLIASIEKGLKDKVFDNRVVLIRKFSFKITYESFYGNEFKILYKYSNGPVVERYDSI